MSSRSTQTSRPTDRAFEIPSLTPDQWAEIKARAEEMNRAAVESRVRSRLDASGVPSLYRSASIDGCPDAVARWAAEPRGFLVLVGKVGRGKTWMACAVLRELARSRSVRFATLRTIADEVRNTPFGVDALSPYRRCGCLCVDDLGKEQATHARLSLLFEVVKHRDENGLPTVLTTNYEWPELLARLSVEGDPTLTDTIASRLQRGTFVRVDGGDRRRP